MANDTLWTWAGRHDLREPQLKSPASVDSRSLHRGGCRRLVRRAGGLSPLFYRNDRSVFYGFHRKHGFDRRYPW